MPKLERRADTIVDMVTSVLSLPRQTNIIMKVDFAASFLASKEAFSRAVLNTSAEERIFICCAARKVARRLRIDRIEMVPNLCDLGLEAIFVPEPARPSGGLRPRELFCR